MQNRKVSKSFAAYYDLYIKYRGDYQIDQIMEGQYTDVIREKAQSAVFDERVMLISLILDALGEDTLAVVEKIDLLAQCKKLVRGFAKKAALEEKKPVEVLQMLIAGQKEEAEKRAAAGNLSDAERRRFNSVIEFFENRLADVMNADAQTASQAIKVAYNAWVKAHKEEARKTARRMDNAFHFVEDVFGDGQEMLILVTELTQNYYSSKFIGNFGCEEYFKHNQSLLFYERDKEIMDEIAELDLNF